MTFPTACEPLDCFSLILTFEYYFGGKWEKRQVGVTWSIVGALIELGGLCLEGGTRHGVSELEVRRGWSIAVVLQAAKWGGGRDG